MELNPLEGETLVVETSGLRTEQYISIGGGGGAGKVNIQDLSLTKYVDKATPNLMMHCSSGKHVPKVLEALARLGSNTPA